MLRNEDLARAALMGIGGTNEIDGHGDFNEELNRLVDALWPGGVRQCFGTSKVKEHQGPGPAPAPRVPHGWSSNIARDGRAGEQGVYVKPPGFNPKSTVKLLTDIKLSTEEMKVNEEAGSTEYCHLWKLVPKYGQSVSACAREHKEKKAKEKEAKEKEEKEKKAKEKEAKAEEKKASVFIELHSLGVKFDENASIDDLVVLLKQAKAEEKRVILMHEDGTTPNWEERMKKSMKPRRERKPPVGGKWSDEEDAKLKLIVETHGAKNWKGIAELLGTLRNDVQCLDRWNKVLKPGLHKGPWTEEEDNIVRYMVMEHGVGMVKWSVIANQLQGRIGKQCRERWFNHLDPAIKKGEWTGVEDNVVFEAQLVFGNRWSEIAKVSWLGRRRPNRSECRGKG